MVLGSARLSESATAAEAARDEECGYAVANRRWWTGLSRSRSSCLARWPRPYALWAIEDRPGLQPPCSHPDVKVTNDLKRYERLKLFILNLGHTWLVELWRLGRGPSSLTVREAMADAAMRAELDDIYDREVLPVFAALGMGAEARAYRDTVIDRFRNPFLDHRLSEISVNHEAKKQRRFGGLIELAVTKGVPTRQPRLRAALAI